MTSDRIKCFGLMCGDTRCDHCYPEEQLELPLGLPAAMPENPKAIYGRAKPSLALIPSAAMVEEAGVYALGAAKYGAFNWRKDAVESMTYAHAALRHLFSWIDGEETDAESGRSHLAHARACLGILIDAKETNQLIDDRPYAGPASRMIADQTKPISL